MSKSSKYWEDRLGEIAQRRFDLTQVELDKQLKKMYNSASKRIKKQVEELYYKLLEEDMLSTTELYSYKRYMELQDSINKELYKLGAEEIKLIEPALSYAFEEVFEKTIAEIGYKNISFTLINPMIVEQIVNANWSGEHFRNRAWKNKDKVAQLLKSGIEECVINGTSKDKLVEKVMSTFGSGFNDADRIVRSELMHILNEGQRQSYKAAGYEELEILVTLDERTCKKCGPKDGKKISVDSDEIPPIHARCRCTTIPIIPGVDTWTEGRLARDPITGKKEKVWADTKYPEWYQDKIQSAQKVKQYEKELDDWVKGKKGSSKKLGIDLEFFSENDWKLLQQKIDNGLIDGNVFESCYNEFEKSFSKGILTPLGNVKSSKDSFVHMAQRHPEMVNLMHIDRIKAVLENPQAVYISADANKREADMFIKKIENKYLTVFVRGDIITSYYVSNTKAEKLMKGGLKWERE